MNKLLTTLFTLAVACVTASVHAQAPAAPAGAKTLEAKTAMCMGCHNIIGYKASFPEVYQVPMIAGQNAKYIAAALTAYKNGDRKHPTMRGIAASLSEQDINDIAAHYEAMGKEAGKAEAPAKEPSPEIAAIMKKTAACVSCHGANFSKPIDPSYPKLAGQHADYLFVALKAYKTQNNPAVGRSNGVMAGVVNPLSNNELKALAKHLASLDGELKTVPESRFHTH
jgi:cytochrome c553